MGLEHTVFCPTPHRLALAQTPFAAAMTELERTPETGLNAPGAALGLALAVLLLEGLKFARGR